MDEFTIDEKNHLTKIKVLLNAKSIQTLDLIQKTMGIGSFLNQGFYISGGAIGSLIRNEKPKDYDFFLIGENGKHLLKMIEIGCNNNSLKDHMSKLVLRLDGEYNDAFVITGNAITLTNDSQLIRAKEEYKTIDDIRFKFDYLHCIPYYDCEKDKLVISKKVYDACLNKKLIVMYKDALKINREAKFLEAGWTIERE